MKIGLNKFNYKQNKESKMKNDIRMWLYLSSFIDLFGASCIVPILGAHLRTLGFSHSLIGAISSAYAGTQLLSGPIVGSWSDSYGRKTVLYFTLFVCALSYCLLGVATSIMMVLFIRVILGLMKHTQTICKTLVADVIPLDKQPEIHGTLNAVAACGFMFGPVIGGHISEFDNGFLLICFMTGSLFLLNSVIVFFAFPDSILENKSDKIQNSPSLTSSIFFVIHDLLDVNWSSFWDIFLLKFIAGISISVFFSNYYVFIEDTFNISPKYIGYTISFQGLVSAASGMQIELFNKLYPKYLSNSLDFSKLNHLFIILSLSFISMYLSFNIYVFVLCLLPFSVSNSFIRTISTELLLKRSSTQHRGSLMGTSNSISSLARMLAPLLTGLIQDFSTSSSIMILGFILSLSGSFISAALKISYKRKEKAT
ncbi:major facilitator superfamily domain-containing protein 9-like [Lycorma delicatula]|uniref:major facilitator superfamily domain-containing protein 9-like n=1 Tax=Lycorma delicatula TaxID=130591 RepID=UPI003F512F19